jgi:hypothetical protein
VGGKYMKNKLIDLNDHLFEQLERLNDEDLKGEALEEEISRSRAVAVIASKIIENGSLVLSAVKFEDSRMIDKSIPKMLEG